MNLKNRRILEEYREATRALAHPRSRPRAALSFRYEPIETGKL